MKVGIIVLLALATIFLALVAFEATKNHVECQSQVQAAVAKPYVEPGADAERKKAINQAWATPACLANQSFGSLVQSLFK